MVRPLGLERPKFHHFLFASTVLAVNFVPQFVDAQTTQGRFLVAQAEATTINFDIPSQSLDTALTTLADQANVRLLFASQDVQNFNIAGVSGSLSVADALNRALAGSGLTWRLSAPGTYTIQKSTATPPGALRLGPVRVGGEAETGTTYSPAPTSVATKSTLPIRQTPFTVNQASKELMLERGDVNIFETLERFAGVGTSSTNADIGQGMSRDINVRGFSMAGSGQVLINGQRTYSTGSQMRNADNLEMVELLRGPAALYYGAAQPGGVINYTYKRPKDEAAYSIFGKTDSEGSYGISVDLTGPLNESQTLLYRVVGNYSRYNDDQNHIFSEPKSTLAAITWAPNEEFSTTLTHEYYDFISVPEQNNNTTRPETGTYYDVPRDFYWGTLNDRAVRKTHTFLWDAKWTPSEFFNVNASLNYQTAKQWYQNTRVIGGGRGGAAEPMTPEGDVGRYMSLAPGSKYENIAASLDFSGEFMTGSFKHEWLVGGGLGQSKSKSASLPTSITCLYGQSRPSAACPNARSWAPAPINIFNPVYEDWAYADVRNEARYMTPWAKRKDYNIYFQDMIHAPNEKTRLLLAMGWSKYDNLARGSYNWNTGVRGADTENTVSKWSPRVALMQDIGESATVYISYGESFNPQSSLTMTDQSGDALLAPEEGVQYEVGYKHDLFDDRAMFSVALFQLEKKNVARAANVDTCDTDVLDPTDPAYCYYLLDGKLRSRGIEFELSGQILEWWTASIGYSYMKTKVVETNDLANKGRTLPYQPNHSLSLWNKVRVYQGDDYGTVSIGSGVRTYSKVHNGFDAAGDTAWNPGYTLVDAGIFWTKMLDNGSDLRVNLNVNNLFDKTYYDRRRFYNSGSIVWGNERRVLLNAEVSF